MTNLPKLHPSHPSVNFDYNKNIVGVFRGYPERQLQKINPPLPYPAPSVCISNVEYETLPPRVPLRDTILGPNSLKKLYEGPWYYPPNYMRIPQPVTMYDMDTSMVNANGTRRTYGFKLYPITHRSPHEIRDYSAQMLPMPDIFKWTNYHTLHDGSWGR